MPSLKPALFMDGDVKVGRVSDSHDMLIEREGLSRISEKARGFTDGKHFLDRRQAVRWLRSNEPDVYKKLMGELPADGLHTEDYRRAKGIEPVKQEEEKENVQDYKTKSVHVQDMGLFTELAVTLSKQFGRVTYTSPWQNAFPSSKDTEVGEGITHITRIDDICEVIEDTDLFVFPDIYFAQMQIYLHNQGKRVFGSRQGDELEIYRSEAKPYFDELKIAQGPYEIIKGINALRKYLKANDGKKFWVKTDKTRGDMETFSVEGYELSKNRIDDLEYHLGPKAEIMTFVVEENLKDTIDIAIDTFCIDGAYPSVTLLGTEEKGECYICARKEWESLPPKLVDIYDKMSGILKKCHYRNFISLESRAKKDVIYLGDPCKRGGSPPLELQLNMIDNLADVLWFGAAGTMIDPKITSKYGVELMIHSDWADKHPLMVDFPSKLRDKIKFRYNSEFDGKTWIMPQGAGPRIAAIVEHGDNLDDIIEQAKEDSSQLKGIQIEAFTRSFPIALEKIEQLKEWGIDL